MPTPQQILHGLEELANGWRPLAVFWHAYFGALLLSLCLGARPDRRLAGVLLASPLLSVSALAWASANPFNGGFFALSGIASLVIAMRLPGKRARPGPSLGARRGRPSLRVRMGVPPLSSKPLRFSRTCTRRPQGVVPCPTLSIVIGVSLILNALGSRLWCLVIGLTGIFYAIFGAARLGVSIDVFMLAGAFVDVFLARTVTAARPNGRVDEGLTMDSSRC